MVRGHRRIQKNILTVGRVIIIFLVKEANDRWVKGQAQLIRILKSRKRFESLLVLRWLTFVCGSTLLYWSFVFEEYITESSQCKVSMSAISKYLSEA